MTSGLPNRPRLAAWLRCCAIRGDRHRHGSAMKVYGKFRVFSLPIHVHQPLHARDRVAKRGRRHGAERDPHGLRFRRSFEPPSMAPSRRKSSTYSPCSLHSGGVSPEGDSRPVMTLHSAWRLGPCTQYDNILIAVERVPDCGEALIVNARFFSPKRSATVGKRLLQCLHSRSTRQPSATYYS